MIPLSKKEAFENLDAPEGTRAYDGGIAEVKPDESSAKMDQVISSVVNKLYREDEAPGPRKDLDTIISENLDRHEAAQSDDESFKAALPALTELGDRYKDHGDVVETLSRVVGMVKAAKADPRGIGIALAESYAKLGPWSPDKPKPEPKDYSKMDDLTASKAKSNDKLDAIIAGAQSTAGLEQKTEKLRAELKSLYPHLKFNEAIEVALKLDTDLRTDPLGGAAQFAAMNGMPWTPRQLQDKAEVDGLKARIDQVVPHLPGFNDDRVIDILHNPQFRRTGDPMVDLRRAHEVAVRLDWQDRGIEGWARQQLNSMEPTLAATVERTIYTDPNFKAQAARIKASRPFGDPAVHQMNFALAVGIAQEKLAAVSKARRAGRVRTSPGGGSSKATSDAGIDAAIARAMRDW